MTTQPFTVADYLLTRLKQLNVTEVFQIPGDYVKHFTQALEHFDGVKAIGAINELDAAYAADAYGRTRGLGAVSLQYGVSTFSALNAIAGAYVERSPVVVISATPGADARQITGMYDVLFHHSTGNLQADQDVAGMRAACHGNQAKELHMADCSCSGLNISCSGGCGCFCANGDCTRWCEPAVVEAAFDQQTAREGGIVRTLTASDGSQRIVVNAMVAGKNLPRYPRGTQLQGCMHGATLESLALVMGIMHGVTVTAPAGRAKRPSTNASAARSTRSRGVLA